LLIPRGAVTAQVQISMAPAGTGGARTTALYRVGVSPRVTLLHAATVTLDLAKAPNGPTPIGDGAGLRLGSGGDPTAAPTTNALPVTGRPTTTGLVFTGVTFDIERVFGVIDNPARGNVGTAPSCVTTCCTSGVTTALVDKACGCAVVGDKELACLQEKCDATALSTGCSASR
jgi:hypothetical protein